MPPVLWEEICRVLQFTFNMHRIRSNGLPVLLAAAFLILASPFLFSQAASETSDGDEIIRFLNQTVLWYRQSAAQRQLVSEPSDVLFLNDNRQLADQVAHFSFDFARARAQALAGQGTPASGNSAGAATTQYQRLAQRAAKADQQVKQTQQELDEMRHKLETATGKKRRALQAATAETESELELFQAQREAVHSVLQVSGSAAGKLSAGSLSAQIEELALTVPAVAENGKEPKAPGTPPSADSAVPATEHKAAPSGILALISDMFALRSKMNALDDQIRITDSLAQASKEVRVPLVAQIRELTNKGDQLAGQPNSTDPAVLVQQKKDLDALTAQYKQISGALLPLGKQSILLDLYKRSLGNWRNSVESQFTVGLKGLLLRLAGLGLILAVVLVISEVWRRATFRYVTDTRRRYQLLLVRRVVLWFLIVVIIAFAFSSELGALTTFAGLLTAGVAIALQSVILSMVGYFFLIGKYGLRVGDRVQVAGITGDVVDIGLVRLHLMEVSGGASPQPTGRVVAFSNSVVFQAGSGLFKPIPGTSFVWHEITMTLGPETTYHQVEQRMLDAVNKVYAEYREKMEMQRRRMELSLHSVRAGSLAPESRVRLTPSGLEVVIRYPVELGSAAAIDDQVTRELLEAIGREPKLRLLGAQIEAKSA